MSDMQAKAWLVLDQNTALIREVIASAQSVAADLYGNADGRRRGSWILVEASRIDRLIAAVDALETIRLP